MHMWLLKQQNSSKIFVDVEDDGSWLYVVDNVVWQSDRIQMTYWQLRHHIDCLASYDDAIVDTATAMDRHDQCSDVTSVDGTVSECYSVVDCL